MDKDRRANQVLHWVSQEGRKRRGRPRKISKETVKNYLRGLNISWERAEELGNGQSRVDQMRCPMYRHAQDRLRSKEELKTASNMSNFNRKGRTAFPIHGNLHVQNLLIIIPKLLTFK